VDDPVHVLRVDEQQSGLSFAFHVIEPVGAQVASPLGAEERRQLVDLLRRVLDNLEPDQRC